MNQYYRFQCNILESRKPIFEKVATATNTQIGFDGPIRLNAPGWIGFYIIGKPTDETAFWKALDYADRAIPCKESDPSNRTKKDKTGQ